MSYLQSLKLILITFTLLLCANLPAQLQKNGLEIPKLKRGEEIVKHTGFSLVYSEKDEQAKWVAYTLTKEQAASDVAERKDNFITDPSIKTGSADEKWYVHSGFDKGHLCPANDNTWSVDAMHDCFYMSNMSPQLPEFNRGIWKSLEMDIHDLALDYDTLYIVTGPVLKSKHKLATLKPVGHPELVEGHAVLENHTESFLRRQESTLFSISIPEYFYKVILTYGKEPKAWGYLIPQNTTEKDYNKYSVSVDEVEKATGLDFYRVLEDKVEKRIVKQINMD